MFQELYMVYGVVNGIWYMELYMVAISNFQELYSVSCHMYCNDWLHIVAQRVRFTGGDNLT